MLTWLRKEGQTFNLRFMGIFFSRDFPSFCLYFFLSRSQLYYARAVGLLFISWRVFLHILHHPRSSFFIKNGSIISQW